MSEQLTTQAMPAWQAGQPIGQLRALAAPFVRAHKPLVFGAFGLVKERDIAPALAEQRVVWTGTPPEGVLLFHRLSQTSHHTDFTGRRIALAAPAIFIHALAADATTTAIKLLAAVKARAPGARLYLEIFEEDPVARAAAAAAGFRYMTTKIAAGSEIKGLYLHGDAPGPAPLPPEELATLEVVKDFLSPDEMAQVREELRAYGDHYAQHYAVYNKRGTWTAFALTGFQPDDPEFIILPEEMSKAWKQDHRHLLGRPCLPTIAAKSFPNTMKLVERIPGAKERVRFMRLKAGNGELSRHADITDRNAGLRDGMTARWHIPIYTSDAVTFHGWSARGEHLTARWPAGCLAYLDRRKPHRVVNNDPRLDRVHLVIDAAAGKEVRGWIRHAMETSTGLAGV